VSTQFPHVIPSTFNSVFSNPVDVCILPALFKPMILDTKLILGEMVHLL